MTSLAASFDPRANSIGFVRWLMAFAVIFSHAGPLAGFYGGHDLGTQWSTEQSLGGVAVGGFFFLSGFLITKSKMGSASTPRYFWRRIMRIYPAWWATLIITAFVLGPIAWMREAGTIDGYFNATTESPWSYFYGNFTLLLRQVNIAGMGTSLPYYEQWGGLIWNGSAWTLAYEFGGYILIAVLGVVGALSHRYVGGAIAGIIIALAGVQWLGLGPIGNVIPVFADYRVLLLMAPFAFGILFALFAEKIPMDGRLAIAALVLALYTYAKGGYLVFGQYAFAYFLMWFAMRAKMFNRWERFGDFSYGIYIIAWPLMQFAAYFQLERFGWLVYHVVIVVGCHIYAFLSWHLIEKPSMGLKNWTPRWLATANGKFDPLRARARAFATRIGFP